MYQWASYSTHLMFNRLFIQEGSMDIIFSQHVICFHWLPKSSFIGWSCFATLFYQECPTTYADTIRRFSSCQSKPRYINFLSYHTRTPRKFSPTLTKVTCRYVSTYIHIPQQASPRPSRKLFRLVRCKQGCQSQKTRPHILAIAYSDSYTSYL